MIIYRALVAAAAAGACGADGVVVW